MLLTALEVKAVRPQAKAYGLSDGNGLLLWITPDSRKYWHFRYRIHGKQPRISLGPYPKVSLQLARERAGAARNLIAQGIDPGKKRRTDKRQTVEAQKNTFKVAAERWYKGKGEAGRSASSLGKMRTYLDKDMLPVLGELDVRKVTRADCIRVQTRIEKRDALNVAKKVRGWLKEIFRQCVAREQCEYNPASELDVIARAAPPSQPYPHLLEPELPGFLQALDRSTSRLIARTAAWMTIRTASRPGIVRFAEWDEIDLDEGTWTVPAHKMKMREPLVIPLPTQLVEALRELHKHTGRHRYLFPGIGTKNDMISENTINLVFRKIGYKGRMVGHGSRHTASTLLREHGWDKDRVERQLAHKEKGSAGDYNHALYLLFRRTMMQWYSDYLDALKTGMTPSQAAKFEKAVNVVMARLKPRFSAAASRSATPRPSYVP